MSDSDVIEVRVHQPTYLPEEELWHQAIAKLKEQMDAGAPVFGEPVFAVKRRLKSVDSSGQERKTVTEVSLDSVSHQIVDLVRAPDGNDYFMTVKMLKGYQLYFSNPRFALRGVRLNDEFLPVTFDLVYPETPENIAAFKDEVDDRQDRFYANNWTEKD